MSTKTNSRSGAGKVKASPSSRLKGQFHVFNVDYAVAGEPVRSDLGTIKGKLAPSSRKTKMAHMNAQSITKSLTAQERSGLRSQPSEQVAVVPSSTRIGTKSLAICEPSVEVVKALTSILLGFMSEPFMSSDTVYLALGTGKKMALANGVSEEEFDRVTEAVGVKYAELRKKNIFATSGFIA